MLIHIIIIIIIITIVVVIITQSKIDNNNDYHIIGYDSEVLSLSVKENMYHVQNSVQLTGSHNLWQNNKFANNIIVGVIDSGIDDNHIELKDVVIKRRNYIHDNVDKTLFNVHGTHVAGIIGSSHFLLGSGYKCKIIDYRVLDINGSGKNKNIAQAIYDSIKDGCRVINLSLGSRSPSHIVHKAVKYAYKKNVLIVCASGNDGKNTINYPGYYSESMCVGAVTYDSEKNEITTDNNIRWFSSTNREVDICADGYKVLSCGHNGEYIRLTGTSMAAPLVSGVAALLIASSDQTYENIHTTVKQLTFQVNKDKKLVGNGYVSFVDNLIMPQDNLISLNS